MCLDSYITYGLYNPHGIYLLDHCRTEPPRHPEPARQRRAVGWRYRSAAGLVATFGLETSASAARGRLRGITRRCPATPIPHQAGASDGNRCLARAVPPLLVATPRCARASS